MNWVYLPAWSLRVLAVIAAGMLALAVLRWWRERRGVRPLALRVLVTGALLLVLLNPQSLLPRPRPAKPQLVALLDTSTSMATRDAGGHSRIEAALNAFNDPATRDLLSREFRFETRRFDRELHPAELRPLTGDDARGDASDIGRALMSVVSELGELPGQAGVLLVSDGRATTPDTLDAAQLALARSVPVWTWTLGGPVPQYDLWMETASAEALAFSGAEVELNATLHAAGYLHRSFKVELIKDSQVIESRELLPDSNGVARVSVRVKAPPAGEQRYLFRVPTQPEESDTANNERAVFLRSVGEKARVLLVEGRPYWDTKFLVQSLKRNPNVDLTAVYRLNAARHLALVSSTGSEHRVEKDLFPRAAEAMNAFDVIVLGRGAEAFFDGQSEALLTDFVAKRGGSLVFARGKPYGGRFQALAKFEPVAWGSGVASSVRLRATEAGRGNPIFDLGSAGTLDELLDRLPALDQASVTLGEKPLAVVLASASQQDNLVLVAYQRYGQGKALSLNAGGLWRWAFRETGQEESELAYQRFWISLLQWLLGGSQFLPGSDVSLASSRRYYSSEQPMEFLVSTRNLNRAVYQPRLFISRDGQTTEIQPRPRGESFVAEAGPFAPGTYHVTLRNNIGNPPEMSQSIEVVSASVEKRELSADPDLMRRVARISGGEAVTAADVARMPEVVRRWEAARELSHRQQTVWDRWWFLTALLGLLGSEWWLRRREGLL